jgi:competence protein ComGC
MKNLRGQTLVASLVVIAIICVLLVVFMKGDGTTKAKADGRGKTVLGNAKATAEDSVCKSNLSQTRQLFQMQKDSDDEFRPTSVADIPGAKSVAFCPVGKEPYLLEIETGAIKCPHPGHGKY